jgi:hypothetical protein
LSYLGDWLWRGISAAAKSPRASEDGIGGGVVCYVGVWRVKM